MLALTMACACLCWAAEQQNKLLVHAACMHCGRALTPFSSWRGRMQVLMLDADNIPLLNPEALFDAEPFASAGCLFWPDFW